MTEYGRLVPGGLVLAGFFVHVAGARWGAYVASPVPGVYLADLLWGIGCALGLANKRVWRQLHPFVWVVAMSLIAYTAIRVFAANRQPEASLQLIVRDLAPFVYLAMVPMASFALRPFRMAAFVRVLRAATLTFLILDSATVFGLSLSGLGALAGGDVLASMVFPGREDIQGAILGIGVIVWGSFPGLRGPSRLVQALMLVSGLTTSSRAAFVAVAIAAVWAVWREVKPKTFVGYTAGAVAVAVCVGALGFLVQNLGQIGELNQPSGGVAPTPAVGAAIGRFDPGGDGSGTASARINTYRMVVQHSAEEWRWLAGNGVGASDSLLQACGVELNDYKRNPSVHKCPVDSGSEREPLRDPHNGLIYLYLYHGVLGTSLFLMSLLAYWWARPREPLISLSLIPALLYGVVATFGVVLSSSFGMLPIATFTSYQLAQRMLSGQEDGEVLAP